LFADLLQHTFTVSGVQTALWLPPLVAFLISFFTSMVGISGAILLLPFQMSVLQFTTPSVTATNLVYNLAAIPSGVYRYLKEGRMLWPLTWAIVAGTIPGVAIGYFLRVRYLPDPRAFKVFAGCVLLYIGWRLLSEAVRWSSQQSLRTPGSMPGDSTVTMLRSSLSSVAFAFQRGAYVFSVPAMAGLAFLVGIIGGIYGIGGGALIVPLCVTLFRLPVYTIAGAALAGTLLTSVVGVALYSLVPPPVGLSTAPDWELGLLFGAGGVAGMYLGARCQRYVPQRVLKLLLAGLMLFLAARYLLPL
jgi:uncharacterized membrane protein YfcA